MTPGVYQSAGTSMTPRGVSICRYIMTPGVYQSADTSMTPGMYQATENGIAEGMQCT